MVQPQDLVAQLPHLRNRVGHQNAGHAAFQDGLHLIPALLAECAIAHAQHLVQNQQLCVVAQRQRQQILYLHAAGQLLERAVLKILQLRKFDDLIIFFVHESAGITQQRAAQVGVLPDSQLAIKTTGQFQQRSHAAVDLHVALRGHHNAGNGLEQRALARAVGADDAQHVPLFQRKGHVFIGPEFVYVVLARQAAHHILLQANVLEITRHVTDGYPFCINDRHGTPPYT